MAMQCPQCKSSRFHVKEEHGRQYLCCERAKACGWKVEIKPPVTFSPSGPVTVQSSK